MEPALVSTRTMDIVVALLFLLVSGIVLYSSTRLGFGWLEGEGPASGYFPFYIGLIMAVASAVNLVRAVLRVEPGGEGIFVSAPAFGRVLAVLVPTLVYVALIGGVSFGWVVTSAGGGRGRRRPGADRHSAESRASASTWLGHLHFRVHGLRRAREPPEGPRRRDRRAARLVLHVREVVPGTAPEGTSGGVAGILIAGRQ